MTTPIARPPRFPHTLAALGLAALTAAACSPGADPASTPDLFIALPDLASPPDLTPAPDDVTATLEPIRKNGGLPALAAAVFRGDRLIAIGATGRRNVNDGTSVTIDDKWHLGSDTKAMTGTLIGVYVDRGKIGFDDTLAVRFAGEQIDPGWNNVTIEQLLQHRGGAPAAVPPDIWSRMWQDGAAPGARATAVKAMLARPPAQSPGIYVYSNAGYMIAGAALERITGKTWEVLMQEDLFTPLKMPTCGFGAPGRGDMFDQPWGHQTGPNGSLIPVMPGPSADNPPSLGPAGTVHCSLADWGHFLAVHLAIGRGEPTIVNAATGKRLQTPPPGEDYAAGWGVTTRPWAGGTALTHSGSNTMWYVTAWLAPAKNVAFAVATNVAAASTPKVVDSVFSPLIQTYAK